MRNGCRGLELILFRTGRRTNPRAAPIMDRPHST